MAEVMEYETNDMEECEREMLRDEQRGANEKVPMNELNALVEGAEAIHELLNNERIMMLANDDGELENALKRTRFYVNNHIFDIKNSPYVDIE